MVEVKGRGIFWFIVVFDLSGWYFVFVLFFLLEMKFIMVYWYYVNNLYYMVKCISLYYVILLRILDIFWVYVFLLGYYKV